EGPTPGAPLREPPTLRRAVDHAPRGRTASSTCPGTARPGPRWSANAVATRAAPEPDGRKRCPEAGRKRTPRFRGAAPLARDPASAGSRATPPPGNRTG